MSVVPRTAIAFLLLSGGCRAPEPLTNPLNLSIDSSTTVPVARLSQSPNLIAVDSTLARDLDLDLEVHSPDLGDIADVSESGGRPLVLNRRDRMAVRFDTAGHVSDTLARSGDGPGEIGVPWGIATIGSRLLILQVHPAGNLLTLVPLDSGASVARGAPVSAGWTLLTRPSWSLMVDFPTQAGIEDWTRRLVVIDDSNFVVVMGDDSLATAAPQLRLLHFRADLSLRDTIRSWPAPPIVPYRGTSDGPPQTGEALFTTRPWFVAGTGWTATGIGDSANGVVTFSNGQQMRVEWPADPRLVSERDRLDAAHWAAVYVTRAFTEARNQFLTMTAQQRLDAEKQFLGVIPFAEKVPQVAGAFGAGNCLWLAGFAPGQFIDGTALTLVGINLAERRLVGPIRIRGLDQRIRHVTRRNIYLKRFDENDEAVLVRYRLPDEAGC